MRERLRERTGQRSVPFVFIGGKFVAAQAAMDGMRGPTPALKPVLEARRRVNKEWFKDPLNSLLMLLYAVCWRQTNRILPLLRRTVTRLYATKSAATASRVTGPGDCSPAAAADE